MVTVAFNEQFKRVFSRIKDNAVKERIEKLLIKIKENPKIGKPMMYERKGTREVYAGSFRLSYAYLINEDKIIILNLYHKDEQ